ncbi:TetR/AcrR family transcriptional regulator [Paenibacillus sp. S150]|uniref:TetR/AcrR family transcriptional regulator n=1 Tax=Paenibacillus sp. S150 TaxID=2749826 RepID=UPI001C594E2D|nr:TetR family transcriptional regulator C-terminal domain-containing protein [Paenibacillus sp. S150]MBW4082272.1 TetR family transcriptional regulator C-terminal domain-containing protein [Paenibacillus sp. S150]
MPKIVDHSERKSHIAEATWRVIMNQGMKGATVRKIAQEAGVSLGALRHYFSSQHELLAFAMNLVKERVNARIAAILGLGLPPKEKVTRVLLELIPVDDTTMAEMEVWFAFVFHLKYADEEYAELNDEIYPGIRRLVDYLDRQGVLRQDLDKDNEAERLYALVDGLALHAMLEPERLDKQRIICVLTGHMNAICNV